MTATYCNRRLVVSPYFYCLCLSEKDYHKELRDLKVPKDQWWDFIMNGANATVHTFPEQMTIIVCLKEWDNATPIEVACLLVHESVHIYQKCRDFIGEDKPSKEFEAYSIQAISTELMKAYTYQKEKERELHDRSNRSKARTRSR